MAGDVIQVLGLIDQDYVAGAALEVPLKPGAEDDPLVRKDTQPAALLGRVEQLLAVVCPPSYLTL